MPHFWTPPVTGEKIRWYFPGRGAGSNELDNASFIASGLLGTRGKSLEKWGEVIYHMSLGWDLMNHEQPWSSIHKNLSGCGFRHYSIIIRNASEVPLGSKFPMGFLAKLKSYLVFSWGLLLPVQAKRWNCCGGHSYGRQGPTAAASPARSRVILSKKGSIRKARQARLANLWVFLVFFLSKTYR